MTFNLQDSAAAAKSAEQQWIGSDPTNSGCDVCHIQIRTVFIDGRTKMGPWGKMCQDCHNEFGCGLGTGNGQMYRLQEGRWIKTCG